MTTDALRNISGRLDLCCINTATLGYRELIAVTAQRVSAAGFAWLTPWRQEIDERAPQRDAAAIRAAGLRVRSYCRTVYFAHDSARERAAAIDENRRALEAAAVLGAREFVAVVGGLAPSSKDVEESRSQILRGLEALMPTIEATGVQIALEPLHPFYAADRSLLNTLAQASEWCLQLDPDGRYFGIAVDAYHVWWDPGLAASIAAAGPRIRAFHVCDWLRHTQEPLLDRGMMGDGVIDLKRLRALVEAAGFDGLVEVEIFSRDHWWKEDPDEVLRICRERLQTVC
jgi:sugar phosphate isomerase/epimerase